MRPALELAVAGARQGGDGVRRPHRGRAGVAASVVAGAGTAVFAAGLSVLVGLAGARPHRAAQRAGVGRL